MALDHHIIFDQETGTVLSPMNVLIIDFFLLTPDERKAFDHDARPQLIELSNRHGQFIEDLVSAGVIAEARHSETPYIKRPRVLVDIEAYLRDTPPWDEPIDESLIPELAAEIARRFDSAEVYDQIDRLGCQLLREHKLKPAVDELVDMTLNPGDYPSPC